MKECRLAKAGYSKSATGIAKVCTTNCQSAMCNSWQGKEFIKTVDDKEHQKLTGENGSYQDDDMDLQK